MSFSAYKYFIGDNYTIRTNSSEDPAVLEKNFSVFSGINDTNNICINISEEEDLLKFTCFERDPMFSLFTLFFIYFPVLSTTTSFYPIVFTLNDFFRCKFFCQVYTFLFFGLGLASLICWSIGAPLLFIVIILVIALPLLAPVFLLRSLFLLTYPFFLAVSPFLVILLKFRSILPHNTYILKMKRELSAGESAFEAAPQLILQFYVLFIRFDRGVSYSQSLAIVTSVLSLSIPSIETFLAEKNINGYKHIGKYYPVFILNMFFRVFSVSIIATFLKFLILGYFLLPVVVLSCNLFIRILLFLFGYLISSPRDHKRSSADSIDIFDSPFFFTLTNLENTKKARIKRKWSTFLVTSLHIITILIIMILCNLGVEVKIESLSIDWTELALVKHHLDYLNIIILVAITAGLGSLLLDFCVYKHCLNSPVFFDQLEIEEEFSVCHYCCMGTLGYLKSVC